MVNQLVTVEPVEARTQLRRFRDIPFLLHREDDRWHPGVRAYESWRLDANRHPYFESGDAAYFLARRGGRPVGRIAAHRAETGATDGFFGFFDAPDDDDVVAALLRAAQDWLTGEGVTSMTGPVSWWPEEEFGVRVDGHEHRAITGRPWQPAWYGQALTRTGLSPGAVRRTYRLDTADALGDPPPTATVDPPPHAGGYSDVHLVLDGIAAVPDVSETLASASLRSAWRVARAARRGGFDTAVCVRCDGDPAVLVPRLLSAARHAGYRWLVAPWAADETSPETVQQVFTRRWAPPDASPTSARR
ncbi:MAG: hypothetical protein OSA99_19255 [Acidimicrobiales bacterium]|nr:hypothetical protein [Acidimicrobiales bacterium]